MKIWKLKRLNNLICWSSFYKSDKNVPLKNFVTNAIFVIIVKKYLKSEKRKFITAKNAVFTENISYNTSKKEIMFPNGSTFIIDDECYMKNSNTMTENIIWH